MFANDLHNSPWTIILFSTIFYKNPPLIIRLLILIYPNNLLPNAPWTSHHGLKARFKSEGSFTWLGFVIFNFGLSSIARQMACSAFSFPLQQRLATWKKWTNNDYNADAVHDGSGDFHGTDHDNFYGSLNAFMIWSCLQLLWQW